MAARARRSISWIQLALAAPLAWQVRFQGSQQLGHNPGPLIGRKLEGFPEQAISSTSHGRILLRDRLDEKKGAGKGQRAVLRRMSQPRREGPAREDRVAHVAELREFLHRFGRETNQEVVVVELSGPDGSWFFRIKEYDA